MSFDEHGHRLPTTHSWGQSVPPRGSERYREACTRCGCIRLVTSGGRSRYYLPGRNPVLHWPPKCKDRSAPPTDGAPSAPQAPTPSAPG